MLAGIASGAAIGIKGLNTKDIKQADAASITGTFTRQAAYYYESSSDPSTDYIVRSSMSTSSSWGTNNFSNNGNSLSLTISETTSNGKWHGIFVVFSYSVTVPAYSRLNVSFPCNPTTYKDSTSGEADHIAEIQFYDQTSYDSLTLCQLMVKKNDPSATSIIGTGKTDDSGVYRVNKRTTGSETGSQTFSKVVNNYNSTSNTQTFYFGFFGYIEQSSTNHHWYATLGISASATTTQFKASATISGTTTYYEGFESAFNAASGSASGGTVNVYADETFTKGFAANHNMTLYLNGHTLTRTDSSAAIFGVASGVSLSIVGGGGKIINNGNPCAIYVNTGGSLTTSNVTIENTQSGINKSAIQLNDGGSTLTLNSGTILKTNGGYGINTLSGGNTIYCTDVTTNTSTAPAIYLSNSTAASKNTLYIGSSCSFGSYIYINNNAYTNLYSYAYGLTYSGSQIIKLQYGTLPEANDVIFSMLNNAQGTEAYAKFKVDNAPVYMSVQRLNTDPTKAIYAYVKYNVTINATNVDAPMYSNYATHEKNLTLSFSLPSNGYYAFPSTVLVKIGNITKTQDSDYTWNQSTGVLTVFASRIVGDISVTIAGVETNKKAVADFVSEYMHMSDYTTELGYCNDTEHHYYSTAKAALLALGADCINEFRTNDAFASAHDRYLKWAAANHDDNPFEDTSGSNVVETVNNSNIALIALIISVTTLSLLVVPFIYIKKKNR